MTRSTSTPHPGAPRPGAEGVPCGWVVQNLPLYVDGELASDQSESIGHHVSGCGACRDELKAVESDVRLFIDSVIPAAPSADLAARIVSALPRSRPIRFERRLPLVYAVAASLVLLVTAATLLETAPPEPDPDPAVGFELARDVAIPAVEQPSRPAPVRSNTKRPMIIRRGDVDGDGDLDYADLLALQGVIGRDAGDLDDSTPCPAAGDFDEDGRLTPRDSAAAAIQLAHGAGQSPLHESVPRPFSELIAYTGSFPCELLNCP